MMLVFLNSDKYLMLKQRLMDLIEIPAINHLVSGDAQNLSNFISCEINKTLSDVQSIGETLSDPSVIKSQELRITIKKFRYTMEFFSNIFGDEIFHCIKTTKEIQNYLGEINDIRIALKKIKKTSISKWSQGHKILFWQRYFCG
jgi:CHAD domain-containing protein